MDGIRIKTSVRKIPVNDNGDCIELNFSDVSLPDKFFTMTENFQRRVEDAEAQSQEMKEKYEKDSYALVRNQMALYRQFYEGIMDEINAVFGPDTCRNVFGDIVPGIELIDEFIRVMTPYFEEYGKEHIARLSKYSAERTGNV